jgi:plasmid stability protein
MAKEYRITVRNISQDMKRKIRIAAKLGRHSLNAAMLTAMDQYVDEWEKSTPAAFEKKIKKQEHASQ